MLEASRLPYRDKKNIEYTSPLGRCPVRRKRWNIALSNACEREREREKEREKQIG